MDMEKELEKELYEVTSKNLYNTYKYLVYPEVTFFYHFSTGKIRTAWFDWIEARIKYYKGIYPESALEPIYPLPPPDGPQYKPCRRMWAMVLQAHVEQMTDPDRLGEVVDEILASKDCESHPPDCACKVPHNPWVSPQHTKHLARLNIPISSNNEEGVFFNYMHNESCVCGTCFYKRSLSSTITILIEP